jgi:hypothetical protein
MQYLFFVLLAFASFLDMFLYKLAAKNKYKHKSKCYSTKIRGEEQNDERH